MTPLIDFGENVWVSSAVSLCLGMLLGAFYFAGLWWTVKKLNSIRNIAPLILLSMLIITGVVMVGFYVFMGNDWRQLLMGLLGFIVIRLFATRFINMKGNSVLLEPVISIKEKQPHIGEQ